MADGDWTDLGGDHRGDNDDNWSGLTFPGTGGGETATFDNPALTPPDANTGQVAGVNLIFDGVFNDTFSTDILTDNATHTAGTITLAASAEATVKNTTHSGVTVGAGGVLDIVGTATGDITFSGTGELHGFTTPLIDGNVLLGGAVDVHWGESLSISGSFDAQGHALTHNYTSGATGTITLDTDDGARDFDLGASGDIGDVAVVVNSGGSTFTCQMDLTCGAFTLSGGTYDDDGQAHDITGHLVKTGGTFISTGAWTHRGTSNLSMTEFAHYLVADGATITQTGASGAKRLTVPSGATLNLGGGTFAVSVAGNSNYVVIQGTVAGNQTFSFGMTDNVSNAGFAIGGTSNLILRGLWAAADKTLTFTSDLTVAGTLKIYQYDPAGRKFAVDMNNKELSVGGITTLGREVAEDRSGVLLLRGGSHHLGGLVGGNAGNLANELDTGSAYVEIANGSTWDGTDIATLANVGAHFTALGTLTLKDFDGSDPGEKLHFHTAAGAVITDGGNNDYADIDAHAAPGSMALCGVGV